LSRWIASGGPLESELFGHVRGAFTGAVANKKGLFEEADGGTCFLDEVGDIGLAMQAKLLRVLQEHEIKRVGGAEPTKIDVRIVAATNKNLEELVEEKKFREDLFYRLNGAIHLPLRAGGRRPLLAAASKEVQRKRKPRESWKPGTLIHIPLACAELENVISGPWHAIPSFCRKTCLGESAPRKERILPRPFLPTSLCPNWKSFTFKRSWRKPGGTKKRQPKFWESTAEPSIGWPPATV
jgi:hypothetical protein